MLLTHIVQANSLHYKFYLHRDLVQGGRADDQRAAVVMSPEHSSEIKKGKRGAAPEFRERRSNL